MLLKIKVTIGVKKKCERKFWCIYTQTNKGSKRSPHTTNQIHCTLDLGNQE